MHRTNNSAPIMVIGISEPKRRFSGKRKIGMFRKNSFSIQINKRIFIPRVACIIAMVIAMVLSGCFYSSSAVEEAINEKNVAADEEFEKEYEAAKKKYEKYYDKVVSGQEVLDLIDNWDEADFGLAVDSVKNGRVRVDNVDKNDPNAVFTYWKKESGWYIDPNAYYKASFIIYQNPRKESDRGIIDLYFHLVEDPSLADDNATENDE